jgi:Predicted membrane protein
MNSSIILILILAIAVIGHADSVAIATCVLLIIKLLQLDNYIFPILEKRGVSLGVIILIATILIPLAKGNISDNDIFKTFTSWIGIAALVLSLLTTYLSGLGVSYLSTQTNASIMPALIAGAVIASSFLGGVPVGPFITTGILALIIKIFQHK